MNKREALENTLKVYDHIAKTGCTHRDALNELDIKGSLCDYFTKLDGSCVDCSLARMDWTCAVSRWKFNKSIKNASMVADAALEALNDLYPEEI